MRLFSTSLRVLVVAILLFVSITPAIAAAETQTGGTVIIGPEETVADGLNVMAGEVTIMGTVQGDLNAFAGDVVIAENGRVTGDVNGFSGSITIAGVVEGGLSGAAGSIVLTETSRVGGQVAGSAGSVTFAGIINGDVEVGAESVTVRETARLGGDLRYNAGTFVNEGTVEGSVIRDQSIGNQVDIGISDGLADIVVGGYVLVVNFLLGMGLLVVFPAFTERVTGYSQTEPVIAVGAGLLTLVGVPLILILLLLTIVGIPLSLVGFGVLGLIAWIAAVIGRLAIGEWLTRLAGVESRWLSLIVGLLAIAVLVRTPVVGSVIDVAVLLLGVGALAVVLYRAYRDSPERRETKSSPSPGERTNT
jgi:cytoskeletal protein CcmA (bactofilin family)